VPRLKITIALALTALLGCTGETPPPEPAPSDRPSQLAVSPAPTARARGCEGPCRRRPRPVGSFGTAQAPEASGLAASRRNRGLFYVLDDGPGTTSLLVIRASNAKVVARVAVAGWTGTDTEGLAVDACAPGDEQSCVFIGDIGDNGREREEIRITRVREPALDGGRKTVEVDGETIAVRYPHGPANAEALLALAGEVMIVTKDPGRRGRGGARLFVLEGFTDGVLQPAGRVRLPPPRLPLAAAILGNVVTGGDATPGRVALRTYDTIYEFTAPQTDAPLVGFPGWPVRELRGPSEGQGEAVAYGPNGCDLFTVSEDSGRLTRMPCR
jgi:hypothetical protein